MLKRKLVVSAATVMSALALSGNAFAAANCAGTVKFSLKWDIRCDGKLAYNLNDGSEKFFCARDNTEAALVLTAQASGADLLVRLADSSLSTCSQNTADYTTPTYVIVTSPT
ncbi:hypothetical protein NBRC116583_24030 [Arenicella sp. 4NH20-0111]|uniref:hypothetical protein n=1 Tax=Arenicella sp. 4NH20-0111 TaxID=3127648 RepID=UPI003101C873